MTEQLEDAHGIEFDTIEPLNEPNTNFWGTQLGADGQPTGGRQEGAHAGPGLQQQVVLALAQELAGAETHAVIAAMDETNPGHRAGRAQRGPRRGADRRGHVHRERLLPRPAPQRRPHRQGLVELEAG